jgi:hypothetical protein
MSARSRTREPLQRLLMDMRTRRVFADAWLLHALRDFGATCYELGRSEDIHRRSTIPAPTGDDEDTGRYSVQHPLREDKTR